MLLTKGLLLSEENVTNLEFIQQKVAMMFALLASVLLLILAITDVFLGVSPVIIWIKLGLILPFLASYFFISIYGKTQLAVNVLLLLSHVVICLNFIFNDGSKGPTIYVFFLMLVVSSLLVHGWLKAVWFVGSLSMFFLLFYAEASSYIEVRNMYGSAENQFLDHTSTIVWISIFVFVVLHFLIKSYRNLNVLLYGIQKRQEQTLHKVEMLNDQKNKLIAILSHDLKNPIGMLHTTLGLVDKDILEPGEMEQILKNLKGQTFHLNKVLNNTLSWVMTELDETPIQLYRISLMELTQEMKEMMLFQALDKNQTIELTLEGEDKSILLEINEVKIILKNLLDNAIKFSPVNSTINLNLTVEPTMISWAVCNHGVTISPADQKDLFSFRARSSFGTKKEKGTGVGLPLCKRIADKIKFDLFYACIADDRNCFILQKKLD